ncbi:MAG: hypothetical protein JW991_01560 [Candidatus Pacebacteria bacterium]|nr:hypothetical protein [Candidatus Paceibacterota bacterium]
MGKNTKNLGILIFLIILITGAFLAVRFVRKSDKTPAAEEPGVIGSIKQQIANVHPSGEVGVLTGGGFSSEFSMALDSNDNVYIVATNSIPELAGVYYKKLDNNGNPLVDNVRVTTDKAYDISMVIDPNTNIHIAWQGLSNEVMGIYYKKLDNNGNSLGSEIKVATTTSIIQPPSIAVNSHDNVYIAWVDNSSEEACYKKLDNNGNDLSGEIRIGKAGGRSSERPLIAIDSNNNIHLVWGNDDVIYYKKQDQNGDSLTDDIKISEGFSAVSPSIALDSSDNVHIAWQDNRRPKKWDIYYKKLGKDGVDLTGEIKLVEAKIYCGDPSIAIDSNDNVCLAWRDDRNEEEFKSGATNYEIYYKKLDNNGKALNDDIRVTNAKYGSIFPLIAIDSENNVHLVWDDERYKNTKDSEKCGIYYKKLRP